MEVQAQVPMQASPPRPLAVASATVTPPASPSAIPRRDSAAAASVSAFHRHSDASASGVPGLCSAPEDIACQWSAPQDYFDTSESEPGLDDGHHLLGHGHPRVADSTPMNTGSSQATPLAVAVAVRGTETPSWRTQLPVLPASSGMGATTGIGDAQAAAEMVSELQVSCV